MQPHSKRQGAITTKPLRSFQMMVRIIAALRLNLQGAPRNQLAVLISSTPAEGISAAYHYLCCMASSKPFPNASPNLKSMFEKVKILLIVLEYEFLQPQTTAAPVCCSATDDCSTCLLFSSCMITAPSAAPITSHLPHGAKHTVVASTPFRCRL